MMSQSSISSTLIAGNNQQLVVRYEELRRRALGGGGGLGLALFLRQGMKAWIGTWYDCAAHVFQTPSNDSAKDMVVPSQLHGEITMLLAAMTLNTQTQRGSQ
jgi:hypothetical protein